MYSQEIDSDLILCAHDNEKLPCHNSDFITAIKRQLIKNLQFQLFTVCHTL